MKYALVALTCLILGAFGGYVAHELLGHRDDRLCRQAYAFINTDIMCGEADVIEKTGYIETRTRVEDMIETARSEHRIGEVSVYFRDLERGPTFGINELAPFAPASLLKLPLAFIYLASAEKDPAFLDATLSYTGTSSVEEQRVKPEESAKPQVEYPMRDILRMMLSYSDNASYEMLESFVAATESRRGLRQEIFQELGVIDPRDRLETTLSVRGYAALFRILYNVSYLDAKHSELALEWLAASTFEDGLVAGVPEGVVVAHKFGERLRDTGENELHDCGIVYYPENPYLLCVMTRGNAWDAQTRLIADISRVVYEEVDSRRIE